MDIACLMGLFPNEYKEEILRNSICSVQNAANKLQWNIVKGLDENSDKPVKIFNSLFIGSFPHKYSSPKIPSFNFCHCENANDLNVGFNNKSIIKFFSKYRKIKLAMKEWIDNKEKDKVLIVYAMTTPFMQLIKYIKKRNDNITICLVIPDLPEYMNLTANKNFVYSVAKKFQNLIFRNCVKSVDCFVLLTEQMKDWFKYNINYTVVEGITVSTIDLKSYEKKKSILYSGMIEKKYGVIDLVKAFIKINNSEWTLDIYGDGSALEEISKIKNSNVILHGSVPNSEVIAAQKESSILVNPRRNIEAFTKYSFPSKIIEYMSSGTAVIAYYLDGMPIEYKNYFYNVPETDDGLYKTIKKVISLSEKERDSFGKVAQEFVCNNKNPKRQCKKILDMIKECKSE